MTARVPKHKFDDVSQQWLHEIEKKVAHEDETTGCEAIHPLVMQAIEEWDEDKLDDQHPAVSQAANCLSTEILVAHSDQFQIGLTPEGTVAVLDPELFKAIIVFAIQAGFEIMPQMMERWEKRDQ